MCKLSVSTLERGWIRTGDVISRREDHEHEGEIVRQSYKFRLVRLPGIPSNHPSIEKLFLMDQLPGLLAPRRTFYVDLEYLEKLAFKKPGWTGASDQAIVTNLLALETATKVRFIPSVSLVL